MVAAAGFNLEAKTLQAILCTFDLHVHHFVFCCLLAGVFLGAHIRRPFLSTVMAAELTFKS